MNPQVKYAAFWKEVQYFQGKAGFYAIVYSPTDALAVCNRAARNSLAEPVIHLQLDGHPPDPISASKENSAKNIPRFVT